MLELRAFNVVPGLVLAGANDEPNVVTAVYRDPESEHVELTFRPGQGEVTLDFCAPVTVIGVSVNHTDPDDDDFGVDAPR